MKDGYRLTPRQHEVLATLAESPRRRIYPGPISAHSVILEPYGRRAEGTKGVGASTAYVLMAAGFVDEHGVITAEGLRAAKILGLA